MQTCSTVALPEPVDWMPVAGGAAIALLAMSNRSKLLAVGALLGGGYLLKRGIDNGTIIIPPEWIHQIRAQATDVGQALGIPLAFTDADVDKTSEDSFPASDPPGRY